MPNTSFWLISDLLVVIVKGFKWWCVVAVLLVMNGCSLLPTATIKQPKVDDSAALYQLLDSIDHWQLQGRFYLKLDQDAVQGRYQWSQSGGRYDVNLSGFFGAGATQIVGDQQFFEVRNGDGNNRFEGSNLLLNAGHYTLRAEWVKHWVLGLPMREDEVTYLPRSAGDTGGLRFRQHGWQVEVSDYQQIDGWTLPRRVRISADHQFVKMTIQEIQLLEQSIE